MVNIHTTAQLQVILVKPERFDDAVSIADHLLEKRTVVLNLEQTNKDVSRRLVDFLSGVAYAGGGQLKKVANSTFIITPYNVNIMGICSTSWRARASFSDASKGGHRATPRYHLFLQYENLE